MLVANMSKIKENVKRIKLNNREQNALLIAVELILCFIWMEFSHIDWQGATCVFFGILSAISAYNLIDRYRNLELLKNKAGRVAFLIIAAFATFSLVGNRGIVYPIAGRISMGRIATLFVTYIWVIPVIISILHMLGKLEIADGSFNDMSKRDKTGLILILAMLIIVPNLFFLAALNPGISSYDTWECMVRDAHNIIGMTNWHPPFYVIFLKMIITVWDSPYAVVLVQIAMWTVVWMSAFMFLGRRGVKSSALMLMSLFVGTNICNCMYVIAIWKDIPYAICLVWLTILIARLIFEEEKLKAFYYIQLVIALVAVCFFRQNGIVPFILSIIVLGVAFRKNKRLIASLIISIVLAFAIRYPIYSALRIDNTQMGGKFIGLGQDITGVYVAGGTVSDEGQEMISVLTKGNMGASSYNPYYAKLCYDLDVPMSDFIKVYIDTFIHNPGKMLKCIMCRIDVVWDTFPGEDSFENLVNYQGHADEIENWLDYYPGFKVTPFYKYGVSFSAESAENQLTLAMYWRAGVWTVLLIATSVLQVYRKRSRLLLVTVPFWAQIIGLLLSTGWADCRYYWPLNLISFFVAILGCLCISGKPCD